MSDFLVKTTYEDLPESAISSAKTFILDTLGVGIAGSKGPWANELLRTVSKWGEGKQARVLVDGMNLPATSAAIVNAYQIHCLEFDCVNEAAVLHPMATIFGALLSEIQTRKKVTGKELILSVSLGVDASSVLGLSSRSPMRFFRPSTAGAFGATASVAKMRGFDETTLINALGATYGQISGTLQPHLEGSPLLGMQIGFCARGALSACDLAELGLEGPKDIFSGMYGYLPLYEGNFDLKDAFANLGKVWQIEHLSHKPFPSGRLTHGMVDGVQRLLKEKQFLSEEIDSVKCIVPPLAHRLTGRPDIKSPEPNYAKLCIPFVTATAIIKGTVGVEHFKSEWLNNEEVHDLAAKIISIESEEKNPNVMSPQFLEIYMKDGTEFKIKIPEIFGHPKNPLSKSENEEKFKTAWGSVFDRSKFSNAEKIISLVDNLEKVSDVSEIVDLTIN